MKINLPEYIWIIIKSTHILSEYHPIKHQGFQNGLKKKEPGAFGNAETSKLTQFISTFFSEKTDARTARENRFFVG